MKNPEQGSRTEMVRQNALIFPVQDTINAPLTPRQAERAAQFLAMLGPETSAESIKALKEPGTLRHIHLRDRNGHCATHTNRTSQKEASTSPEEWLEKVKAAFAGKRPEEGSKAAEEQPEWMVTEEELAEYERQEVVRPVVRVKAQALPELKELLDLEQFRPKRGRGYGTEGAGALAKLLHVLSRRYLSHRPYLYNQSGYPPRQVVLHLPTEMLAYVLEVSENTIREWAARLERAGFLCSRGHYSSMTTRDGQKVTVMDGTLYAVRLAPGHTARLRYSDYKRAYRDLDADRKAGRTAYNAIRWAEQRAAMRADANVDQDVEKNTSGSISTHEGSAARVEILDQLYRWAVIPGNITSQNPLNADSELFGAEELNTVQDVVYLIPTLVAAHVTKRAALVGIMASTISKALNDQHSRRYWCRVIWDAWQEELAGHDGLQHLAAQLQRLAVDLIEWQGMRNPAAVFAARMRAA